jgi:Lipase maturation factor
MRSPHGSLTATAMDWFDAPDSWLSRLLLQRGLGVIYLVAFLNAVNQFRPLLGEHGLLPVPRFLAHVRFRDKPSLFHLRYSDRLLLVVGWAGVFLAAAVTLGLPERGPLGVSMAVWLVLWVLYLSIVNVGQTFYTAGYESLLLEAGFLAVFLGNAETAPPVLVLWLYRWLLVRVEVGSGVSKIRSDRCWRDLTCLDYHHETQPTPNPLSRLFHHLPRRAHRIEVLGNHFAQLVVPIGLLCPQPVASVAAGIIIVSQLWLMLSGNYLWLNAITIVIAFAALDDRMLDAVVHVDAPSLSSSPAWFEALVLALVAVTVVLSYRPARNFFAREPVPYRINGLHFVTIYGMFGYVTRERFEIVVEGTDEPVISPETIWREYEFKGQPGDPMRRPRQYAPYHLRLEVHMWIATVISPDHFVWFRPFLRKLLEGDDATLRLLRPNPFPDAPPLFVRARWYRYRFTTRAEKRETGAHWVRTFVAEHTPALCLEQRREEIAARARGGAAP